MDHYHRLNVKLDDKNYFLWASYVKIFLEGQELWGYIDGSITKPTAGSTSSKWTTHNAKIKTWLMESVEASIAINLSPLPNAKDMWDFLARIYRVTNKARLYQLEKD
jgi:hypothetical protein